MPWYTQINRPSDRVILHLMDVATVGAEQSRLTSPAEVETFLESHPEIEAVNVYSGDFPRRPVPVEKFDAKMIKKLFKYAKAVS